jgi:hypothetical protein
MADRHNPPRGWRDASAGGTPESSASSRPKGSSNKGKQIFTVLAVMLALAGAVVGILYLIRPTPRPYFVPIFITEYTKRQIPVNFQAESDRKALVEGNYFEHMSTFGSQERNQLMQELAKLHERSPSDAVILYVCAFARASDKGEVLLLPGDFNPDDAQTAVKLRECLEMLRDSPAGHKLLILDTMRPLADPRLGVLTNDVASRVSQELKAVEDPHRMALLSCSPGQVSLASEDLGRSVFGYYLEEGLRGWAQGWNSEGKRQGQVSARELAEFVKRRVDRWAERNRGTRQTPILLPKDPKDDFQMIVLEHGQEQLEPEPREVEEYPASLIAGWKVRDDAWEDGGFQLVPRAFRELEAYLLRAELQWRGGMELKRMEQDLKVQLDRFRDQMEQAHSFFQGEPRSLTLARALGRKSDSKVADALKEVLAKNADLPKDKPQEAAAARDKLIQEFLDKNKGKQFDVACAVFDQAAAESSNQSVDKTDKIRFLSLILQKQDSQPRYVETLLLAGYLPNWSDTALSPALARRAIEVVQKGETALSRPRLFPWTRSLLEAAAQDRHTADVFLAAPGCVSASEIEKQLNKAVEELNVILTFQDALLRAQRSLDEALIRLPAYLPYLEAPGRSDDAWRAAAQGAKDLHDALSEYPKQKLSADDLRKKIGAIGQKAESLRSQLDDLRRPFESETVQEKCKNVQEIIKLGGQADANISLCLDIQSMLATPILNGSDRVKLWRAGRALSGKLNQETLKLDQDEDQAHQTTKALSDFEADQERAERAERDRSARRAYWALALLKLSGLGAAESQTLQDSLNQAAAKSDLAAWDALAAAFRKAWVDDVPRKLQEASLEAKDRLNVPYPPFDSNVDDPNPNAVLQKQTVDLKQWLARWYQYESQDVPSASGFFGNALREYRADPRLEMSGTDVSVQFSGDSQVPSLTPANPSAVVTLQLQLTGAAPAQPVEVNVLTADDNWLQVTPDTSGLPDLLGPNKSCTLPIRVSLKTSAQNSATPPPQGFLVQARVNDRAFHYKVAVSLVPRPEILLSTNPVEPKDPLSELALRPGKSRLKYYLYLRNHTDKPQMLSVELLDNGALVDGGVARLTEPLKPNETRRIDFGKVDPPADKPLRDIQGPLQIRLRDLSTNNVLDTKQIPVRIATPREYVEVTDQQYDPGAGGNNRLQFKVRAKRDIPDPGCEVKLVLPTDGRIPGFTPPPKEENTTVILTKKNQEKELFAAGINLAQGANPNGYVYLTVDGVERAFIFKTTFNPGGGITKPDRFDASDIRIQALPPYARPSKSYNVTVNVDNPPDGTTVLLELARKDANGGVRVEREAKPTRPEPRDRHLGFSPQSADGALLCEAQIRDWVIPLDTSDIAGELELRATLRSGQGSVIGTGSKSIVLDNTEPTKLEVVEAQQVANGVVEVTVKGEDPESGVQKVKFHMGQVDSKNPAKGPPLLESPFDNDQKSLTKKLQVAQIGDVELTAEFVNGVDLSAYLPIKVAMVPNFGGNAGQGKLGSISGKVVLNEKLQPGSAVKLEGGNLKEPKNATADKRGGFTFDKVPPGTYKLTAKTEDGKCEGHTSVTVEAGKPADTTIEVVKR